MGAHNDLVQIRRLIELGEARIPQPTTGTTIDLKGKQDAVVIITDSIGFTLPDAAEGTRLLVCVDDTSTVIISDSTGILQTFTGTSGSSAVLCVSTGDNKWTTQLMGNAVAEAGAISIADASNRTDETTVEGALNELFTETYVAFAPVASFLDADGDPLAKWVDGMSDGFDVTNGEALGIRWNPGTPPTLVATSSILLPLGANPATITVHVIASKTGNTVGDATTFTIAAFQNKTGATHDGGSDLGGVTSAMVGNAATKTVQHVTLALTAPSGSLPGTLTFSITPTNGTLGTDDVTVEAVYFTYTY